MTYTMITKNVSRMKLLTSEIIAKIPPLYSQENAGAAAKVVVKFFDPCGAATWYITEGNPIVIRNGVEVELERGVQDILPDDILIDFRFFGLCYIHEAEFGYVMYSELASVRGRAGLGIERDRHFDGKIGDTDEYKNM